MNYLFDTGIIIGLLRESPKIVAQYIKLPETSSKAITVYTLAELYEGINKMKVLKKRDAQLRILGLLIDHFEKANRLFALTKLQAYEYSKFKIALEQKGTPIPVIDLLIGTIAFEKNLTLITTDKTHFQTLKEIVSQFNVEFWES